MKFLVHLLLSSLAVFVAAKLLPGVTIDGFGTAVAVAIVFGLINAVLKPILLILTLPINILTLGLFTFVIIGGLVQLTTPHRCIKAMTQSWDQEEACSLVLNPASCVVFATCFF